MDYALFTVALSFLIISLTYSVREIVLFLKKEKSQKQESVLVSRLGIMPDKAVATIMDAADTSKELVDAFISWFSEQYHYSINSLETTTDVNKMLLFKGKMEAQLQIINTLLEIKRMADRKRAEAEQKLREAIENAESEKNK